MYDIIVEFFYRTNQAAAYGGNMFEYIEEHNIKDYDLLVDESAVQLIPLLFSWYHKIPTNIYNTGDLAIDIVISNKKIVVKPLSAMPNNYYQRAVITFIKYNYTIYDMLIKLNYIIYPLSELVDYSLYKNVVLIKCKEYIEKAGGKCLFTAFPKANKVVNKTKLEKYLSDHSIYGYTEYVVSNGINKEEIYACNGMKTVTQNNVQRFSDYKSNHENVVSGFRVTSDQPADFSKNIWCFGSSVNYGYFADDEHTISSELQRCLNSYFGESNEYCVINASNYAGNNVDKVYPLVKELPIKYGDICIFNIEFPRLILNNYKNIVDLSIFFSRPHNYGEIFVDINHMIGKGYCAQGKILFDLLKNNGYFSENIEESDYQTNHRALINNNLSKSENIELIQYCDSLKKYKKRIGSIVMNCNPFTLGHRYLIEEALKKCDQLFIFVVEEDKSYFKFKDRFEMVKQGTADLKNVEVIPSGKYIISSRTFDAYSNKAQLQDQTIDCSLDVDIFARYIAPAVGINIRFVGEEPLDNVTNQYNVALKTVLPGYGIDFYIIPRKRYDEEVISASRVRRYIESKEYDKIESIVPKTTFDYLKNVLLLIK